MALDSTKPADSVAISEIPSYLRETRAAIQTDGITGVTFEANVADGDLVFLDQDVNVWRRSLAASADRDKFYGVADVSNVQVIVFGFITSDTYVFTTGATVYVSTTTPGNYTETPTGLAAGVAVGVDTLLIDSQISASFDELRDEIIAARDGEASLSAKITAVEADITTNTSSISTNASNITTVTNEVTAARDGESSLLNKVNAIEATISTNASNISTNVSDLNAVEAEIIAARGSDPDIDTRLDGIETDVSSNLVTLTNVQSEVTTARGSAANLDARLDVSLNEDGTLRTTTTVSNFAEETATVAYVDGDEFTVAGDKTSVYVANRALRFNASLINHVLTSSYSAGTGLTLVQTQSTGVPTPLTRVDYSFNPEEMPIYDHGDLSSVQGADDTDTNTTQNRHVSNNQMKTITDWIAAPTITDESGTTWYLKIASDGTIFADTSA